MYQYFIINQLETKIHLAEAINNEKNHKAKEIKTQPLLPLLQSTQSQYYSKKS